MTHHRQKSHMQWINFSPEIGKAHTGSSGVVVLAKGLAKWWARNPWYDSVEGEVLMSGMKWLQWLVVFHSLVIFKNKSTNRALPDLQLSGETLQGFNYHSNTAWLHNIMWLSLWPCLDLFHDLSRGDWVHEQMSTGDWTELEKSQHDVTVQLLQ